MATLARTRPGKHRSSGKATEDQNKLDSYTFHGLNFTVKNGQGQADCPFCGADNKFFVSRKTGQYDCKACGEKGNVYTFIAAFHKLMLEDEATAKATTILAKARGIPAAAFENYDIAYDGSRFYFPRYCFEGKFVNLDVWDGPSKLPDGSSRPVFPTAGLKTHLLGAHKLADSPEDEPIYLCEGHWDYFALEWLREKVGEPGCVLGKPGTGTFKEEWVEKFKGRDVILLDDNDVGAQGGKNKKGREIEGGQPRTIRLLSPVVKSLTRLAWPAKTKSGYDVNDFIRARVKAPKKCWADLTALLQKIEGAGDPASEPGEEVELTTQELDAKLAKRLAPGKPPELAEVLKAFRRMIHLNKNMEDAITIALAVVVSIRFPGDPVWIFLIGPPGTGKTLFLESLENCPDRVVHRSRLRPHDLVSGYITSDGSDPSLLKVVQKKTLIIKDFTTVKSLSPQEQEGISGILRDAYDGRVHVPFANITGGRNYPDCHFAFIAAVTDIIHVDNRSSMGERFLKVEFLGEDNNTEKHILAALDNADKSVEFAAAKQKLQAIVSDFIDRNIDATKPPAIPVWLKPRLAALARVVAILRASVERSHKGDLHYRTRAEVGTRLAGQLLKLGKCLAVIRNKRAIDEECYRLMEKVALDTAYGWNLDTIRVLLRQRKPIKIHDLARLVHISESALGRKIENMLEIKLVIRDKVAPPPGAKSYSKAGQPANVYSIHPDLRELWKAAKLPV